MPSNSPTLTFTLFFDGGCRSTNPGNKYGSYAIWLGESRFLQDPRFELGWGTNNEAEFESLIKALTDLIATVNDQGLKPTDCNVVAHTDSRILVNRVTGKYWATASEPAKRMAALTYRVHALAIRFGSFTVDWIPRERNVEVFGH